MYPIPGMESQPVASEYPDRIWFYPSKFWAATKGMSKEQVEELMDRIASMAEREDMQGLSQHDFIYIGNPYRKLAS